MRIMRILILTVLLILTAGIASQISAQSNDGGARTTQTTASADELRDCSQMLDQSIAEARALKAKVTALEQLVNLDNQIIAKKDETIGEQKKLIDLYEKRRGTRISFLFGLIKISKN